MKKKKKKMMMMMTMVSYGARGNLSCHPARKCGRR